MTFFEGEISRFLLTLKSLLRSGERKTNCDKSLYNLIDFGRDFAYDSIIMSELEEYLNEKKEAAFEIRKYNIQGDVNP